MMVKLVLPQTAAEQERMRISNKRKQNKNVQLVLPSNKQFE